MKYLFRLHAYVLGPPAITKIESRAMGDGPCAGIGIGTVRCPSGTSNDAADIGELGGRGWNGGVAEKLSRFCDSNIRSTLHIFMVYPYSVVSALIAVVSFAGWRGTGLYRGLNGVRRIGIAWLMNYC